MKAFPEAKHIIVENVQPRVDDGRYPVKREVGDSVTVTADAFRDGHDKILCRIRYRIQGTADWHLSPMECVNAGLDVWRGEFSVSELGFYEFAVEAYCDLYGSWAADTKKKIDARQSVASDLLEGLAMGKRFLGWLSGEAREICGRYLTAAEAAIGESDRAALLLSPDLLKLTTEFPDPATCVVSEPVLRVWVDRVRARYAAWYELFPRSCSKLATRSGTFREVEERLPEIKGMGFDVLYFPPIHPIGKTNRKGRNNSLKADPGDPGCPYSIGSSEGGHDAIEPGLGTFADFERLVRKCAEIGMEIAIDFAINCSPDHPWLKGHDDWFSKRPDGTIKYAENPPKKYEDIYPINFDSPDREGLYQEMKRVIIFWCQKGVRIFRVDNPHTKPFVFWEWLIREVQSEYPDALFLSEAFTRPKVMAALAKIGFSQSYTYFTWRNFKDEIAEYFTSLTKPPLSEFFRANLFVNTPDILPTFLQRGGRPAFKIRAALATMLSSLWGMYSGFELCENEGLPGKEEYLNSEKYEIKPRDWNKPGNIKAYIAQLNRIRRENPALQEYDNLRFLKVENDHIVFFERRLGESIVLVAVNLDPFQKHHSYVYVPVEDYGIKAGETFQVHDLLAEKRYLWTGPKNYVELTPEEPANIFVIRRWLCKEQDFDYFI